MSLQETIVADHTAVLEAFPEVTSQHLKTHVRGGYGKWVCILRLTGLLSLKGVSSVSSNRYSWVLEVELRSTGKPGEAP